MPSQLDLFNQEVINQAGSLNRIQKDTVNEVVRLLKQARANVQAKLKAQPTDYNLWYQPQLIKSIEQMLDVWQEEAGSAAAAGQGKAYTAGQNLIDKPVEKLGIELHALAPKLDMGQLKAMVAFTTGKIKDVSMDTVNRINSELALTVIGSQTPFDTIQRVQQIMEGVSKSRATCIVRTELGRAYGVAGQARLMQAVQHVPAMGKQWRRSGKIHSRRTHDLTDGQVRPADQPFIIGTGAVIPGHEGNGPRLMHPHDPKAPVGEVVNCGCISLPFLDEWKDKGILENPGKKAFTEQEIALNPLKADLNYMDEHPTMEQYQKEFDALKATKPAFIKAAKTIAFAQQVAQTLGVKSAHYGQSLDVGNDVNQALEMLQTQGLPVPDHVRVDAGMFAQWQQQLGIPTDEPAAMAVNKTTGETHLVINPDDPYWDHPQMIADYQYKKGVWSTNHKYHAVIHEAGHAAHFKAAPTLYTALAGKQLTPDEAAIAAKVSDYATDDPREFVAETFAVLATGGTVSADIMALYTALGGQKP